MTTRIVATLVVFLVAGFVLRGAPPPRVVRAGSPLDPSPHRLARRVRAVVRGVAGRGARARRTSTAVGALLENWAAGLRAGAPASAAFDQVCADLPAVRGIVPRARAAARHGGDLAGGLRADGGELADPVLRRALLQAAACAAIAEGSGGRLADALDRIGAGVRAERDLHDLVLAQLAGPRATARLLALLPIVALVLESGAGMRPLEALRSGPGPLLVVGGVGLVLAGLVWNSRIARSAIRGP